MPIEDSSAEADAPFAASQLVRGTLRSPEEPLIDFARLQRSLYRGLAFGAALAPIGYGAAGLRGAIDGLLFGLVATPVAWVEFWAERRPGSLGNDALAGVLAALVGAVAFGVVNLQSLYVKSALEGEAVAGFARRLDGLNLGDLKLLFLPLALVVGCAYGASVIRRLRRYLPRRPTREVPLGSPRFYAMKSLGIILLAIPIGLIGLAPRLFCPLFAALFAAGVLVSALGYVYRAADTLELELRLWRERRADP